MDELILARHGLAGSNRDGIASCAVPGEGLVPEGVEQARALGELLADDDISLAATTDLARTQETLALALGRRDVPRILVPELNEIHFGSFDGGLLDTYREWAGTRSPDERAPGGGESRADAAARFARGLRVLLGRNEAVVLLVGHALMVRYTLDAADGLVPAARMAPVAHAHPYRLDREAVEHAVEVLEAWSAAPAFRG
jgi:broad specificity phosphatase PhoE